jgi:hypothetical protein
VPGLPDLAEARGRIAPLTKANEGLLKEMNALPADSPQRAEKAKQLNDNLRQIAVITKNEVQPHRERVQFMQELGGLAGRVLLAIGLVMIASKRTLLWLFQVPGLFIIPFVWWWVFPNQPDYFTTGVFLAGLCIVAQFSYFGEFLPEAFPVQLRGTGGAFATNVGGRMIGTSAAFLTTNLIAPLITVGSNPFEKVAYAAGVTGLLVFAVGFLASFFLPKPRSQEKG